MVRIISLMLLAFTVFHRYEFSCVDSYHECGPNDPFRCIPKSWKCDSNVDCQDGSDEVNCPPKICEKNQFKCVNSYECISMDLMCDGKVDCLDFSDEDNCKTFKEKCNEKTQYDCKNEKELECIPLQDVCHTTINCSTNRDRKENCSIDLCVNNKSPCSHICINKFSYFLCDCPPGMILDNDNKTCKHIDECLETPNICSQECTYQNFTHTCTCYKGYIPKGKECIALSPEDEIYLFYSSHRSIYSVPIFGINSKSDHYRNELITSYQNILSFDIKLDRNEMIVCSSLVEMERTLAINRFQSWPSYLNDRSYNKYGENKLSEMNLDNLTIYSTALDPARNLLFFTDRKSRSISVVNITSMDKMKIIEKDIYLPISLVVDPISSKLFWIDLGDFRPKIEMANTDGSSRITLLENDLQKPISLAIDIDEQKLYWANHFPPSIHFIDLKLINKKITKTTVILENVLFQPFSISIFGNRIYWSDWRQNRIYSAHKINGKGVKMIKECEKPMNIRIISKEFNDLLIAKVQKQQTSKLCNGLINTCPYSCLPKFNSPGFPICFGIAPVKSGGRNYLWFILIPIVILITGYFVYIKNRKPKPDGHLPKTNGNVYLYDNVKFWEEDQTSIQEDNPTETSISPIINNVN